MATDVPGSTCKPTELSTISSMMAPAPGTPAVPMEASTAVMMTVSCWLMVNGEPMAKPTKMAQTPW